MTNVTFQTGSKLAMNAIKPRKLQLCVVYKVLELPQNAKLCSAKYKMDATVCSETFFQWCFNFKIIFVTQSTVFPLLKFLSA